MCLLNNAQVRFSFVKLVQYLTIICISFVLIEFVLGMSQFSVKGNQEARLRFAFRVYDMDNDGYISNGELFQVCLSNSLCAMLMLSIYAASSQTAVNLRLIYGIL